jgi:hypothetical protein
MKLSKNRYLQGFGIIVILLSLVRCIFPSIAEPQHQTIKENKVTDYKRVENKDSIKSSLIGHQEDKNKASQPVAEESVKSKKSPFFDDKGNAVKHKILSVPCFAKAFPDMNDEQLISANKYGVKPVFDRDEAESRKAELVYVGGNPYFYVDRLHSSIPYLIPRASILLQDIGRSFFDSLCVKGVPLHKIIVTSVMRSKADVNKLRGHNGNATQNSCHLYGTTFDVCYNRYKTVEDPNGPSRRKVRNDTLKWVLSEVLNDMRKQGRCYIKYEVHQGCFHITVK